MRTKGSKVEALLQEKIRSQTFTDMPRFVKELENREGINLAEGFAQILDEPRAFDLHRYAICGLRTLADQGRLSKQHTKILLQKTLQAATIYGLDEIYETLDAVVRSGKIDVLLAFVEKRFLDDKCIRDWRWIAFSAVGLLAMRRGAISLPQTLKEKLIREAPQEPNPSRRAQLEELVKNICLA